MINRTKSMAYIVKSLAALSISLSMPITISAQDAAPVHIGFAAEVERVVQGQIGEADFVPVQYDDDIFFNEIITTEPDAIAVMSFRDGSTLEIGPNSAVTIDEFVFNPVEGVKTQTISAVVGTFRFVSGMAMPNQTVTINTPTATLGIRGSEVNMAVTLDGTAASVTNGSAQVTQRSANSAANVQTLTPGSAFVSYNTTFISGANANAVGLQLQQRINSSFGDHSTPEVSPQRRNADTAANLVPAGQQSSQSTESSTQSFMTFAEGTYGDLNLGDMGVQSAETLANSGIGTAAQNGNALTTEQQNTLNSLNEETANLQSLLNDAIVQGEIASQNNHELGTTQVITGLAESGNVQAVTSATTNAAQADSNQATPAVSAAAANLNNVDANAMTGILQGAISGLQAGGSEVNGNVVGSLTSTAINNLPPGNRQAIGNAVATNVATNFATSNPNEAASLAAALNTGLTGANANIAANATQNLATQLPGQAQAINTAANNAAAANLSTLPATAAGVTPAQLAANTNPAQSSGPAIANAANVTGTGVVQSDTVASGNTQITVPNPQTLHGN